MRTPFFLLAALTVLPPAASAETVKLGGQTAEVRMINNATDGAAVEFWSEGKLLQTFPNLGEKFRAIEYGGKQAAVVTLDPAKDGFERVIVRTWQPPFVGSLWVFEWDKQAKRFSNVLNARGERSIPVPLDTVVRITPEGSMAYLVPASRSIVQYRWNGHGFSEGSKQ